MDRNLKTPVNCFIPLTVIRKLSKMTRMVEIAFAASPKTVAFLVAKEQIKRFSKTETWKV